jgi:hypothetical protein
MADQLGRREFLGITGSAAFAGCLSSTSEPTSSDASDPNQKENDDQPLFFNRGDVLDAFSDRGVEFREFQWGYDPRTESPAAVGVVENTRGEEIASARVAVDFYDGDVQLGSRWTMPRYLGPGEFAQVHIPAAVDDPDRITRVAVDTTVRLESLTPQNDGEVTITAEQFDQGQEPPVVSGTLENETDDELSRVYIHINFYDGDELVYWRKDGVSRLSAGNAAEWEVSAHQNGDRVADYKRRITVQQ